MGDGLGFEAELVRLANTKGIANTIRLDFVALIANDKVFDLCGAAALLVKSAVQAHKAPASFQGQSRVFPNRKACGLAVRAGQREGLPSHVVDPPTAPSCDTGALRQAKRLCYSGLWQAQPFRGHAAPRSKTSFRSGACIHNLPVR